VGIAGRQYDQLVIQGSVTQVSGLRERKKAQTRRMLIDTAVDLCLRQGYECTTIEQIVETVEVSPRTFSRYFASKDAVFVGVIDEFADEIAFELDAQPVAHGPMEALRAAHMAVLMRVAERRPLEALTVDGIVRILQVVYSSDTLRQAAIEYRHPGAMAALARHMCVTADDRGLELAVALFSTAIVSACQDLVTGDADAPLGPDFVMARLERALAAMSQFAAELRLS
jgi:AcrR family transcriptional regulator